MGKRLSLLEKTIVFVFSFFAVILFLSNFRIWQLEWQEYLLRAEKWPEIIFIFAVVTALTLILTKLLQWEYRVETRPKKKR